MKMTRKFGRTLRDVQDYRKQVYNIVTDLIRVHPAFDEHMSRKGDVVIMMAFEHERIH